MNEEEFICIRQVTKTVPLALPGCFAHNETAGIKKVLEKWKRKYTPQLKGILVDYRNVTFRKSTGILSSNAPKCCYIVKATFDLFCPKVGDITKGKINRTSKDHIGCLIQNTINVSIRLPDHSDRRVLKFIHLNREILFEIIHFNFNQHVIDVKGEISPKCIELMNSFFPQTDDTEDFSSDEKMDVDCDSDEATTEMDAIKDTLVSDGKRNLENGIKNDSETPTVVASPRKKKKKHKEKRTESSLSDVSTSTATIESAFVVPNTILKFEEQYLSHLKSSADPSPTKPNKKKRKRDSSVSDLETSGIQPKKKKRHKSEKDTDKSPEMEKDESSESSKKKKHHKSEEDTDKSPKKEKDESSKSSKKKKNESSKSSKIKKDKSKSSKKKTKVMASGSVLKKDKKKPHKSKGKKKGDGRKSKKKSKKDGGTDKSKKLENELNIEENI